jgi:hypothetical protein
MTSETNNPEPKVMRLDKFEPPAQPASGEWRALMRATPKYLQLGPEVWPIQEDETGRWIALADSQATQSRIVADHAQAARVGELEAALRKAPEVLVSYDTYFDWWREVCLPALEAQNRRDS